MLGNKAGEKRRAATRFIYGWQEKCWGIGATPIFHSAVYTWKEDEQEEEGGGERREVGRRGKEGIYVC